MSDSAVGYTGHGSALGYSVCLISVYVSAYKVRVLQLTAKNETRQVAAVHRPWYQWAIQLHLTRIQKSI